jgi:hypothetical protein
MGGTESVDDTLRPARPLAITLICLAGFAGSVFAVPLIFSREAAEVAPWYPFFFGGAVVCSLVCLAGMWRMRRWGVYMYAAFHTVNQMVMYSAGLFSPVTLAVPLTVAAIAFLNVKKMR